jgi:hypothetical protein
VTYNGVTPKEETISVEGVIVETVKGVLDRGVGRELVISTQEPPAWTCPSSIWQMG